MKSEVLSSFSMPWLSGLGLILFFLVFVGAIGWWGERLGFSALGA